MHGLCPQLGGRRTWNREKSKGHRTYRHGHKVVHNGPEVGVSNDEHQLQKQRHCFTTEEPTVTPYELQFLCETEKLIPSGPDDALERQTSESDGSAQKFAISAYDGGTPYRALFR